ncbi:MAG: polyprenyl synthetase family protein [Spirochaetales bacterium]
MDLETLYQPIASELDAVKVGLSALANTFHYGHTNTILEHFFQRPGKLLRPALVLLSAKALVDPLPAPLRERLVQTALGVELLHDASLVHDDVLDSDTERRGQATLNGAWGNKIAVLAGDVIYSRGFGLFTQALPQPLLADVIRLNEQMCSAEIEQARTLGSPLDRETYFRIIEGKTAAFMSVCCHLGASVAAEVNPNYLPHAFTLRRFGLAFGLAYQLFDDHADGDLNCPGLDGVTEGRRHLAKAVDLVSSLPPSPASLELSHLCSFLQEQNS